MRDPRQVSKTAFELSRAIFIDTSAASIERREHLIECGHAINRLCDDISRLTPDPVHEVTPVKHPRPIAFTDNFGIADKQHGLQREEECNRFGCVTYAERSWAKAGWESGWDSAIRAMFNWLNDSHPDSPPARSEISP